LWSIANLLVNFSNLFFSEELTVAAARHPNTYQDFLQLKGYRYEDIHVSSQTKTVNAM
jgi:hypothetical protein